MNELGRILSDRKRSLLLLFLPLLCLGMFLLEQMGGNLRIGWQTMMQRSQLYREKIERYRDADLSDVIREEEQQRFSYVSLYEQAVHVRDYEAYLKNVQVQAERMSRSSVFGGDKNSFVYRNIQKTAKDFLSLEGRTAEFGSDLAVEQWISFGRADVFHLLVILLFVLSFLEDKRLKLSALVRATPDGRKALTFSRVGILFGVSALFTLLFYGLPLLTSLLLYGGAEDLGRSVQSLVSFKTCTLSVSIRGWIVLFLAVKAVCGFFLGLFFWFVLSFLNHMQLAWLVIIGIVAVEYALKTLIAPQMAVGFLRYINLFSYISPTELLSRYQNMNFFGQPVGSFSLMAWLLLILFVLFFAGLVLLQICRHPLGNRDILGRLIRGVNRALDLLRSRLPLLLAEGYKLLFLGGTLIFLALGVYAGLRLSFSGYVTVETEAERIRDEYVKEAKGPITEKTYEYLGLAREQLEKKPGLADMFRGGLDLLEQEIRQRVEKAAEAGYEPWVLDQTAITGFYGTRLRYLPQGNAFLVMAFLILCAAPVFAFERQGGTERLLRAAGRGRRRTFLNKYLILLLETLLLWAAVYGREWRSFVETLGAEFMKAPVQNAVLLESFPLRISLGAFEALLELLRLGAMLLVVLITAWFSRQENAWEKAVLPAAALLLIPAALVYFEQRWAGYFSLLPFVSGIDVLADSPGLLWLLLLWLGGAVFLTRQNYRGWVRSKE